MARTDDFLLELYKEKRLHKEHRHKYVVMKFILTGSLLGFSQISKNLEIGIWLCNFIFIIPFLAYIIDIYICAEHYKVQRIGKFINNLSTENNPNLCDEEIKWEKYLQNNREGFAIIASLLYSFIITIFSIMSLWQFNYGKIDIVILYSWIFACAVCFIFVLFLSSRRKILLVKM